MEKKNLISIFKIFEKYKKVNHRVSASGFGCHRSGKEAPSKHYPTKPNGPKIESSSPCTLFLNSRDGSVGST